MSKPSKFQATAEATTVAAAAALALGPTPAGIAALAVGAVAATVNCLTDDDE